MGISARALTQWWSRVVASKVLLAVFGVVAILTGGVPHARAATADVTNSDVARLEAEVERLEASRAVKHLQRAYGFYMDRALWQEAADLFAPDATFEVGSDGVYAGRDRIAEYLRRAGGGGTGLPWGILADHYQLQPVVHVSADGLSAKARWRDFGLLGEYGKSASWEEGIFENEYVKRGGVWMIKSLHLYVTFVVPYEKGWARATTHSQVVPFHYPNPAKTAPM